MNMSFALTKAAYIAGEKDVSFNGKLYISFGSGEWMPFDMVYSLYTKWQDWAENPEITAVVVRCIKGE